MEKKTNNFLVPFPLQLRQILILEKAEVRFLSQGKKTQFSTGWFTYFWFETLIHTRHQKSMYENYFKLILVKLMDRKL